MSYGVFSLPGQPRQVGWRRGDRVLDLSGLSADFAAPTLNRFLARGPRAWQEAREAVDGLRGGIPIDEVELHRPVDVADYVDFYSSLEHATNLGRLFRPDGEPLLPNWRHLPVGYHGRAGTVVVSGTEIVRPVGQRREGDVGPTERLDFELELGWVVGAPSQLGRPVPASAFAEHVFGFVLVNDWSARDLQAWEYQPLGPFLGKSFATSISAWVTPLSDLAGARVPGPPQEPEPARYLRHEEPWHLDVELEVELNGTTVSRVNASGLYWSFAQQLAHLTVNGASLRTGDLCASGTISGAAGGTEGSLVELTANGERPLRLADGSERSFLADGDEVVLRGRARELELGEVRGRIAPAPA